MLPFRTLSNAFKKIYQLYAPRINRFAYSFLKDKVQSEEIVQETFISLWENRQKFNQDKALEPYLFTICKRLILDGFRKVTSTNVLREKLLLKISQTHNDTEDGIILSDLMVFAESAIKELPKQQQIVFRLSRFEELSYEEIADRLNLSKNTVKNHLVVAVKTLRAQFSNQEIIYLLFFLLFY
jgi:RNA polymerase sigma-70 factor (family 1)